MEDNSSEEHKPSNRNRGRKRCARIENSDSEESNDRNKYSNEMEKSSGSKGENDSEVKNNKLKPEGDKQLELQKKLKFIFNEVRETGKYEYNKQEIPENLKYHSDESDSSEVSGTKKSIMSRKVQKEGKETENKKYQNINSEKQISERLNERQIGKIKNSKMNKDSVSNNSRKKSNNYDSKNKEVTYFNDEDNFKKSKEANDYDDLTVDKTENGNKNNINNMTERRKNMNKKKFSNNYEKEEDNLKKKEINDSENIKSPYKKNLNNDNNDNKKGLKNSENKKWKNTIENNIKKNEKIEKNEENEEKNINIFKKDENIDEKSIKKDKSSKLKNLLENKKDIILQKSREKERKEKEKEREKEREKEKERERQKEKEKINDSIKETQINNFKKNEKNSFSKKRFKNNQPKVEEDNEENNNDNNNENENKKESPKKEIKKNNVRELIEKLKAKKNEKEDLTRLEKEAEEQSIMRGKAKQSSKNNEETINESEVEREAEKIRLKEKRMEERRIAREKRRRQEEEEKKRKEKEFEEKKRKEEEKKKKEEERKRREEEEQKRKKEEEERKRKEEEEKEKEKLRKKREKQKKEEEKESRKMKVNDKEILNEKSRGRKNSEKMDYLNNYNLPKKTYKNEEDNDEEDTYTNSNVKYSSGKQVSKYNSGQNLNKEEEKRRKQLEKDLEDEINKIELSDENDKNKNVKKQNSKSKDINKNEKKEINLKDKISSKLERSFDALNAYKKPVQKNLGNGKSKVYCPKRPGGVVRGRSHEKVDQGVLNKIESSNNFSNYVLTSMNSKKLNGNNLMNSPNVAYTKKRSMGSIGGDKFLQLNKSFGEFRPGTGIENGNNFMNGMYNINTLELGSLHDLNSSFDSRMLSYNNNFQFGLNNDFYNRTAQKNYHNNTINSNNLVNNSNRLSSINNFFSPNNMRNLSNLNGLNYMNIDNDNFINMTNMNLNSNNSLYDLRAPQLTPYDLNSSYNIGYNNPLTNYPSSQVNLSKLLSNNYLGLNNGIQRNISSNYVGNSTFQNILPKKSSSINIEDLLVLEEKLSEISTALNKTKVMHNECFEFWNYYFNCSLYGSLEKLFTNLMDSNNVQISINYILMSILICYDCSFEMEVLNNVYSVLKDLLNLNHKNLMLIYEHILSKISTESRENIWVLKLLNIVNSSKNSDLNEYNTMNGYSMTLVEKINFNTGIIIQNIRVLLKNYKTPKVEYLTSLFKKINDKSYEDINNFYRQYILRVDNMNGSILASVLLRENLEFKSVPAPYLHTTNHKPYSLILDLDETLVHFKVNTENESEGVLKVRPGVMEFLDEVDKYYELIIFTCATQDYANLLIDAIEENKIYFEHRLYRQHTVIIDNDFVKDLTRIGRPLDKIAIVDNMPQNFRLQKENGINIKPFWGEDIYDTALINLSPILINIAEEGGDIRKGLAKYRDEIVEKVTSNISKHNI